MAKGIKTGGRTRGTPNRMSRDLKEVIIEAAETAGDGDLKAYLAWAAKEVPGPFLALLGKLVPLQVAASLATPATSKEQRDAVIAAFSRANH